jgi:gamma-D-glutamyl-L-lysine dipeptidyl-peptidase
MMYCTVVAKAPMRAQPNHRAEMVNELLFGEAGTLLHSDGDFVQVKADFDGYEGWVERSQLAALSHAMPAPCGFARTGTVAALLGATMVALPLGSPLHAAEGIPFAEAHLANFYRGWHGQTGAPASTQLPWQPFLGAPYLWGGKTPWGTDCSGFVQQVFKLAGTKLPRDASQQAQLGETVHFLQATQLGDLAFFDNAEGKITHVGLLLTPDCIVHASGEVRIDHIDNHGIVHAISGQRTHSLRVVKRMLPPNA